MASVYVDIDLNDIDDDEVISQAIYILKTRANTEKTKELLKIMKLSLARTESFKINTLDDQLKYEHLLQVYSKYTLPEIQSALPL